MGQSINEPLRILCAREIQKTIADSVHRLLADQISLLNLGAYFTVLDHSITNAWGAEFLFAGLRDLDAHKIKSYEGIDVVWVEEAHTLSKRTIDILDPTIRAPGAELWFTFNPELDTDPVYEYFVKHPPEDAYVVKMNYTDNPWFSEDLDKVRLRKLREDPEGYRNIWLGEPRTVVEGAIYGREVIQAIESRRIRPVPYNPRLPVHTVWDLGWNDQTSIIFVQRSVAEACIIDYEEESFLRPDEWAKKLIDKPYVYGSHWLPHDGGNKTQAGQGLSIQDMLHPLLKVRPNVIMRPDSVEMPIRAARMMWPRVYINDEKCARLVECLKRFRRNVPESTGEPGAPVKDEYRHGADAFGYLGMVVEKLQNDQRTPVKVTEFKPFDQGVGY